MDPNTFVHMVVNKGVNNVNLSMFSEQEKKQILQKAAETYMRQGRMADVLTVLEHIDLKEFADRMRPLAEQCVELGDYQKAALIYEKIGYQELAEFINENFVKK